jgi:hypothetical protein
MYNFNPYYQQQYQRQYNPQAYQFNPQVEQFQQPQTYRQNTPTLQGKSVDNIDVVKAMDIPLDGSISYFPIADGSAIVTKQLQADGTSRTIVYKPIEGEEIKIPKYITPEELDEAMKKIDNNPIKEEIKTMKRQIKDLHEDLDEIKARKE